MDDWRHDTGPLQSLQQSVESARAAWMRGDRGILQVAVAVRANLPFTFWMNARTTLEVGRSSEGVQPHLRLARERRDVLQLVVDDPYAAAFRSAAGRHHAQVAISHQQNGWQIRASSVASNAATGRDWADWDWAPLTAGSVRLPKHEVFAVAMPGDPSTVLLLEGRDLPSTSFTRGATAPPPTPRLVSGADRWRFTDTEVQHALQICAPALAWPPLRRRAVPREMEPTPRRALHNLRVKLGGTEIVSVEQVLGHLVDARAITYQGAFHTQSSLGVPIAATSFAH